MSSTCYAVIATLPDETIAQEYIQWLEDGHVDQVIDHGAHSGMIVRLERNPEEGDPPGSVRVMTQYIFSTRQVFDHYVQSAAPALRAEGLARFGPSRGVRMQRLVGTVL